MFQGKKVLVTGATRGIGKAIATAFRERGAFVIGTGVRTADASNGCDEYYQADFGDLEQICRCAEFVRQSQPDVLVNNAGVNKIAPFVKIAPEDFRRIQQVNVFAPFCLCQAAIPGMKRRGWGRIVGLSSIWGVISKEYRASYSASKFAMDGMTLALALEHAADGILANCVAPGFVDTEMTRTVLGDEQIQYLIGGVPAKRVGTVDEIARLVVWLASPENTYVTGQNIVIDGGFSRA